MRKQQQMFRGCPYEDCFESALCGDCRNCPEFDVCKNMMNARIKKAKKEKRKKFGFRNRFIAVFAIAAFAAASLTAFAANRPQEVAQVLPVSISDIENNSDVVITNLNYYSETDSYAVELLVREEAVTIKDEEMVSEEILPIMIVPELFAYGPGKLYYYDLNESEKLYIAKMVYREARGESFEGKVACAAVALNRYVSNDRRFDRSSIYAIITQSGQFADIHGVTQRMLDSVPECMEAVEAACKGWDPTRATFPETGALFFYSPKNMSEEGLLSRAGVETHVIGNHNFHVEFNPDYAP